MNSKTLATAFAGLTLLLGSTASAQIQAGVLGQRYVGASAFTESLRNSNLSNGNGGAVTANVPVAPNFDFSLAGSYERFSDYSIEDKRLFGTLRAYQEFKGVRPFVDLGLGGTWQSSKVGSRSFSSSDSIFAAGAGIEVPFTDATALLGRAAYQRYSKSGHGHYWTYTAAINHWFTERVGAEASVLFWDNDSTIYSVGLLFRF